MTVIFAGNHREALRYCQDNNLDPRQVVIASSLLKLEGLRFTRDDVVFVGDYYERPDFIEIWDLINRYTTLYAPRSTHEQP